MAAMITIYSKQHCTQCTATIRLLDKFGLTYEVIEIDTNPAVFDYVKSLGFMSMPVVETPDDKWCGFRPDKIKQLAMIGVPA